MLRHGHGLMHFQPRTCWKQNEWPVVESFIFLILVRTTLAQDWLSLEVRQQGSNVQRGVGSKAFGEPLSQRLLQCHQHGNPSVTWCPAARWPQFSMEPSHTKSCLKVGLGLPCCVAAPGRPAPSRTGLLGEGRLCPSISFCLLTLKLLSSTSVLPLPDVPCCS